QGLYAAQAGGKGEQAGPLEDLARGLNAPSDLEGKHPAESAHLASGQRVLGMRFQTGVPHCRDGWMPRENPREVQGIGTMRYHPQAEGLGSAENQPGIQRPRHPTADRPDPRQPIPRSGSRTTKAPPSTSLCPPRYLVVL